MTTATASLSLSDKEKQKGQLKAVKMTEEVKDYFEKKFGIRTEMPKIEALEIIQAAYFGKERKMYIPLWFGKIKEDDISHEFFHHIQHSIGIHNWEGKGTALQMSMSELGASAAESIYKMRKEASTVGKIVNVTKSLFYETEYNRLALRKKDEPESMDFAKEFYYTIRDAALNGETPQACFYRGFGLIKGRDDYDEEDAAHIFATKAALIVLLNKNLDQNKIMEFITKDETFMLDGFIKGIMEEKDKRIPKILDGIKGLLVAELEDAQDNHRIDSEISILKLIRTAP